MRLTRLYAPHAALSANQSVPLTADQAHYVLRVLRLVQDAEIVLFNEESGAWRGNLQVMGKHAAVLLHEQTQQPMPPNDIWLLAAPLKKDAWDFVLEKSTELGVAAIQPVISDYTQSARINAERSRANLVEASQQCERTHIPQFFELRKLDALLATWDKTRIIYAALERVENTLPLRRAVAESKSDKAAILIGPEGGFSQHEKELLLGKDFVIPVSLGPLVLRAETAAVAALAIWQSVHAD